jgi:hypothetical protein
LRRWAVQQQARGGGAGWPWRGLLLLVASPYPRGTLPCASAWRLTALPALWLLKPI